MDTDTQNRNVNENDDHCHSRILEDFDNLSTQVYFRSRGTRKKKEHGINEHVLVSRTVLTPDTLARLTKPSSEVSATPLKPPAPPEVPTENLVGLNDRYHVKDPHPSNLTDNKRT